VNSGPKLKPLDKQTVRELWSRTYNKEGKMDWSHLFPCYDDGVVFQDSVQRVGRIDDFKAMCGRVGPTGGSSTRGTTLICGEVSSAASPGDAASPGGSSIDYSDSSA
jgi:hypothetical protein